MTSIIDEQAGGRSPRAPLLELATGDLYANNPFRVLGVRVDASRPDIDRIEKRRSIAARLGKDTTGDDPSAFPPHSDPEESKAALRTLDHPIQRFLAELFWFWPAGDDDEALRALDSGDVASAIRCWEQALPTDPVRARHNLAVLHHARALGASAAPPQSGDERRALELWSALHGERSFWRAVSERAESAGDARVSEELVRAVQDSFALAILLVHGRLAVSLATAGDARRAREQMDLIHGAGFGAEHADAAIRQALTPARSRLTAAMERAKRTWEITPQRGAELVQELRRNGLKLLGVVDALLREDDVTRRGLHDDFADVLISGVVAYGNRTEDWPRTVELLNGIEGIAVGAEVKDRLEKNRTVCADNANGPSNWCAPGYWDLPADRLAELEAARELADAGDFKAAIERLVGLDADIGHPLMRALAYCMGREALRIYHERNAAGNRRDGLLRAAEYELLADELDPGHPTITRQLDESRRELAKLGVRMPTCGSLRGRLHGLRSRAEAAPEPEGVVGGPCHFCGAAGIEEEAAIEVPLCGDVRVTRYPLGQGTVYRTRTVVVPRCADCLAEHTDLPERIEAWRGGFMVSGSDESFPELAERVRYLTEDQEDANRTLTRAQDRLARAEEAALTSVGGPTSCDRCSSEGSWDDLVCRDCDAALYRIGPRDGWAAIGVGAALFLNLFFGPGTTLIDRLASSLSGPGLPTIQAAGFVAVGATVAIGALVALLFSGLGRRRTIEREELRATRRRAHEVTSARLVADAEREVEQARKAVGEAEAVLVRPRQELDEAKAALEQARAEARSRYEAECPWPVLSPGVAPESEYVSFPSIVRLIEDDWGYGAAPTGDGTSLRKEPEGVVGLVST